MIVGMAPRCGFDDFWASLLTVFQLLTTSDIGMLQRVAVCCIIAAYGFSSSHHGGHRCVEVCSGVL